MLDARSVLLGVSRNYPNQDVNKNSRNLEAFSVGSSTTFSSPGGL